MMNQIQAKIKVGITSILLCMILIFSITFLTQESAYSQVERLSPSPAAENQNASVHLLPLHLLYYGGVSVAVIFALVFYNNSLLMNIAKLLEIMDKNQ